MEFHVRSGSNDFFSDAFLICKIIYVYLQENVSLFMS